MMLAAGGRKVILMDKKTRELLKKEIDALSRGRVRRTKRAHDSLMRDIGRICKEGPTHVNYRGRAADPGENGVGEEGAARPEGRKVRGVQEASSWGR
jgi:hypothetical protein